MLVFLHVPKTAGSTVNSIIHRLYPHGVARVDPNWRTDPSGDDLRDRFRSAVGDGAAVVAGHFPYGVHRWVDEPCRYFTVLRDPVERVVSAYVSFERKPHLPQHERIRRLEGGIENAVDDDSFQALQDLQTRILAGFPDPDRPTRPRGPCTEETLDRAKANLDRCDAFGLTERFDEGLVCMRRAFGWPMPLYRRRNTTRTRTTGPEIDEDVRRLIEERNPFDRRLYEYARELFERRWSAVPGAERDLRRLRVWNVPYRPVLATWEWLRPARRWARRTIPPLRRG